LKLASSQGYQLEIDSRTGLADCRTKWTERNKLAGGKDEIKSRAIEG
jgi:hypothetical protein